MQYGPGIIVGGLSDLKDRVEDKQEQERNLSLLKRAAVSRDPLWAIMERELNKDLVWPPIGGSEIWGSEDPIKRNLRVALPETAANATFARFPQLLKTHEYDPARMAIVPRGLKSLRKQAWKPPVNPFMGTEEFVMKDFSTPRNKTDDPY